MELVENIEQNILQLEQAFKDCGDLVKRKFPVGENGQLVYIAYIDGMVNSSLINENVVSQLIVSIRLTSQSKASLSQNIFDALKDGGVTVADLKETNKFDDATLSMMSGDTVLFIDGFAKAIILSTKGFSNRGVQSPDTEVVIQGSKDAFSESIRTNTMLIRRRIRDTALKIVQKKVGRRSKTDVALVYLEDVVRPQILQEAIERIDNIDIDAILESGYVEQLIEEDWLSPFPQAQTTERPDKASAAILEGRIAIIVDNSPFVLIIPATIDTFFQSPDDYYQRFEIASFIRLIRFVAAFGAMCFPGLYIAIATYHPSMLPMQLAFKFAGSRQTVPFTAVIEVLIMEIAFELLREAGIRLPAPIGGTIGIVGGIVIGQAAVEAGIVSPIVVIIVALTGICSFVLPHISLVNAYRILKYLIIALSSMFGFLGFWLALLIIIIHVCSLKSFGIPYMFPFVSGSINDYSDIKDTIFRFPLFSMKKRPIFSNPSSAVRLNVQKSGNKRKKE